MSAFQGTVRLIYEDAYWFLGKLLLLYITLPLTAAWIIIGISFELNDTLAVISGPAYFYFIPAYGIMGFKFLLPIAVGLGCTRTQLLKTFYIIGTSAILASMLILNLGVWLISSLYERGISSVSILHPGMMYSMEYQFLPYLWIDLMVGLVLFGGGFFIYCIIYRLGMTRTLIGVMIIGIPMMFLYYSGMLEGPIDWLLSLNMNATTAFTLTGIAGLAAILATYPMMRNASLEPKAKRE